MSNMRMIHRCSISGSSCHVKILSGHSRTWQAACGKAGAGLAPRAEQEAGTSSKFWDCKRSQQEQGRARVGMQKGRQCDSPSPSPSSESWRRLELSWQPGPRGGRPWRWPQARQRAEFRALPALWLFQPAEWHIEQRFSCVPFFLVSPPLLNRFSFLLPGVCPLNLWVRLCEF